MTMMCQFRLVNCKKCTIPVGDIDSGGGYACVGAGTYGNSLCLLLNFFVKLKLLFKKSFTKKENLGDVKSRLGGQGDR